MRNDIAILVLIIAICIGGSFYYKKWITEDTLKKLYKFKKEKNTEGFLSLLNSPYLKFNFSKFTLFWMQLNYFIDYKMEEEIEETFLQHNSIGMNNDDLASVYFRMFVYYIDSKQISRAKNIYCDLSKLVKESKNAKIMSLEKEVEQLYSVYCDKNTSYISKIQEDMETCTDNELKSVGYFRIAKLYHYLGKDEKVNEYLENAIKMTKIETNIISLQTLLKDHKQLD